MTEKDKQLLNTALNLPCTQWYKVYAMIEMADDEKTKESLKAISMRLYHKEEYLDGVL